MTESSENTESSGIAVEWRYSHEDNYGAVDNIPAGHTSLVFNDRVWLLGGIGTLHSGDKKVYSGYRDSVLSSTDGVKWNIEVDDAPWAARTEHSSVLFSVDGEERMWIFGGHTVDDNDAVHPLNDVWSSADGRNWRKESPGSGGRTDDSAIWAPRYGHSTVVYDGAIWLFGGSDSIDGSSDEVGLFNDVWRSDDGKVWTKVMDSAEWSGRLAASAAVFTVDNVEKIFLIGGIGIRYDEVYEEYGRDSFNDIWSYTAGASSWTQEVTEAPWVSDFGKVALVNDGRLWLIAGQTGGIWFTVNGRDWSSSESNADRIGSSDYFSIQRVATSAVIYNGEIWLVGGVNSDAGDVTFFQDVLIGKFKSN